MLNVEDDEYSDFLNFLKKLNLEIRKNDKKELTKNLLADVDILIIGNPINDYFSISEINSITNFVRSGGSLLLISEYGSDYLQKTNINDISRKNFGIYFNKNIIKEKNSLNEKGSSILTLQNFPKHFITNQLRELIIGGACSLILDNGVIPLLRLKNHAWSEIYNNLTKKWDIDKKFKEFTVAACSEYGKGKVVALGDIDLFSGDNNLGINQLDNRKFVNNIFEWLLTPIKETDVINWSLNRIGIVENSIKLINSKISNIIESITMLEKRISEIEDKLDTDSF
ncbi:MAG: hypothetical protein GF317_00085 [Candidatus Lokiarchaeota archaeon]|nr:hypothetical protein [Candidatus Lokiarchaeota archaeon]MBD3198384.1 hypothetical protein [Candidatus Lokiarchaeota archaeon]